ncbi:hypothetical protein HYDPIDRAFT_89135 [Hydnomerulius pinastri MD-312]|uniref:Uncharacterized protein n=1 Tax=Hydnomerulius pinastri MD-312 TaxID=994086 RepID=A0A0C9WFS4_9AGAM|nr:hypothetical protein HYDPIDRAFT_89135 [Hydnomerulius pinastri MD-312]
MLRYPHTRLFSDPIRSVVLSGPHIQVLDTKTGAVLHTTATSDGQDRDAIIKSGPIHCSAISHEGNYLATTGDDKRLKIWDLESLGLLSVRELPKKPTSIQFSKCNDVIVADKFGDVFRYPLHPTEEPVTEKKTSDGLASHENPSGGELVLGHASLLTSSLVTPDEQFIITADRDEHIRVSWYPQGYTIESYCLGHEKYVSAIHLLSFAPASLISGGGDRELKVWDWMTGRLQQNISVFAAVEPFIKVKAQKRKLGSQEDGNEDAEAPKGKGRRRNKGKGKQNTAAGNEAEGLSLAQSTEGSNQPTDSTETVFVVCKISSFVSGDQNHVVFSAVGATAIFDFILGANEDQPEICHFDFGKPVLDFTMHEDGSIWSLLDVDYPEEDGVTAKSESKVVRVIRWTTDQFVEAGGSPLLDSLNSVCLLPATADDLKTLDLYSDLTSLPKSVEVEAESRAREQSERLPEGLEEDGGSTTANDKGLTKRTLGRLKHKRALERLQQREMEGAESPGPESKRAKAEVEGEDNIENTKMDLT